MPYIKSLVMCGFKSFASEINIPFNNGMNVFVGANGSGKSNIADAICFVLGRLSAKSIRAEKNANLIFAGTKERKLENEASVSLVFDNSDKIFSIESGEIKVERVIRRNGQGIYKINNEIKTRQEIIELMAQAGIDPNGFNIILQGNITDVVGMSLDERRRVIEEVAGISVYENRKEKSLHELEKTDMRLKEASAILRERSAYLRNLEDERQQAIHFKKLEETVKRCKATIISKLITEKLKEVGSLDERISKLLEQKNKKKGDAIKLESEISALEQEIQSIQGYISKSSGLHQEQVREEITKIRAELGGLAVKKENLKLRISELGKRKENALKEVNELEKEILELKKKSPAAAQKQDMLRRKRDQLAKLEEERKNFYNLKTSLSTSREKLTDKKKQAQKIRLESDFILHAIEKDLYGVGSESPASCQQEIKELEAARKESLDILKYIESENIKNLKLISVFHSRSEQNEKIIEDIKKLDVCPLCKTKITAEHMSHVSSQANNAISELKKQVSVLEEEEENLSSKISDEKKKLSISETALTNKKVELARLEAIESKKTQLKRLLQDEQILNKEIADLENKTATLEMSAAENPSVSVKYEQTVLELQEISSRTEENIGTALTFKERDLEATKQIIRQATEDMVDLTSELGSINEQIDTDENLLVKKEEDEQELTQRFQNFLDKKNLLQQKTNENNSLLMQKQHEIGEIDRVINEFKINKARLDAEKETLDTDFSIYNNVEIMQAPIETIKERLEKAQSAIQLIGSVNLRALEVYEQIKTEYDSVKEKVTQIELEKGEIMKIIQEIDNKKKKTYMKTLREINELFKRNFSQLSTKGEVSLTIEDEENPFAGGLAITVKVGKGKYFDVTSLSGGEQTLVALSLIFAIQEYKPYPFYIFDEVDAALDKRNSERLASLIKRYHTYGQYIVITHNDALIAESPILYGVSMQDGISKVISLKV